MQEDPKNTSDRDEKGRFLAGNSGNGGRRKGARSRLGEQFIQALADDFEENGVGTIRQVRMRDPVAYIKVVKDVLPREVLIRAFNVNASMDISTVEEARMFLSAYRLARDAPIDHIDEGSVVTEGWRHDD